MIVLNFSHPLSPGHVKEIETLTDQSVERVTHVESHIDPQRPLVPQVMAIADEAGLSPDQWQTLPLLINPPALNVIAVTLLAELHGRCGYFPACLRMRPVEDCVPTRYEVAEILNLQTVRDAARGRRDAATN